MTPKQMQGGKGYRYFSGATDLSKGQDTWPGSTSKIYHVDFWTDTVIHADSEHADDYKGDLASLAGQTIPAGEKLTAPFKRLKITSGSGVAWFI